RITNVGRGIIVLDRTVEPLTTVHSESTAGVDTHRRRNVRVITIVPEQFLIGERSAGVERKNDIRHRKLRSTWPSSGFWQSPMFRITGVLWLCRALATRRQRRDHIGFFTAALGIVDRAMHGGIHPPEHRGGEHSACLPTAD